LLSPLSPLVKTVAGVKGEGSNSADPEFVNLLQGAQESIISLAESIPWNQFLGFLSVYKFGL
jgi:hypothetical protein